MAFNVFESSGEGAYFVVLLVGGFFSVVAVVLRFVAGRHARRVPAAEDWFALAAVLILLIRCIMALKALTIINGRDELVVSDKVAYESAFELIYVVVLITMLDQTMAKLSICFLYMRIFGVKRSYARCIQFLGVLQIVTNFSLVFVQAFQCKPVEASWKYWVPGKCISTATGVATVEPPNSIVDFFLVILAVIMVRSLQMSSKNKWRLRLLFGLGALAGVFGFIKVGIVYATTDPAKQMSQLGIWAIIQSFASILCCCAPVYKPLLPASGLWGRLTSKLSQYRLRGSRSGDSARLEESFKVGVFKNDSLERPEGTRVSDAESRIHSQRYLQGDMTGSNESAAWYEAPGVSGTGHTESQRQTVPIPMQGSHADLNSYPMNAIHVQRSVDIV